MFKYRPRPDTLTQTLTVRRPPSPKLLSRTMHRFAGRWMLSSYGCTVVPEGGDYYLYRLDLTWRSDKSQYAPMTDPTTLLTIPNKRVKIYDSISCLDRLRLCLLVVESSVRRLTGRA